MSNPHTSTPSLMNDEWCNEINNGAAIGLKIKRKLASKQSDFQLVEIFETEEGYCVIEHEIIDEEEK